MKRILVKLSGEALAGEKGYGIDPTTVLEVANELKTIVQADIEMCVVCGGGNIWRGEAASKLGMDRSQADYMGMMATVMNSLALQDALESLGVPTRVQTALRVDQVAEPYIRRKAIRHMEKKRIVILAGGTGMPYFSTDSNAMLRASELDVDGVIMAKNGVDGVYDKDPNLYPDACKYDTVTYSELLDKQLKVIDLTASSMAQENNITTIVVNMNEKGNIIKAISGEKIGTVIKS